MVYKDLDFVLTGYAGLDRIIRVEKFSDDGATAIVTNKDNRKIHFGGNGTNVSYCLARLGCKVAPIMRVGANDYKDFRYLEHLEEAGVDTSAIAVIENESTSLCQMVQDSGSNHMTLTYPGAMNVRYATEALDDELFKNAKYGIITVATYADIVLFLQKCRKHKLPIFFGVRIDLESFPGVVLRDVLYESQIISMNESERDYIEKEFELTAITDLMDSGKTKIIITTLGKKGCTVFEKKGDKIAKYNIAIVDTEKVVDATGAGDSFNAGFLYGLIKGESVETAALYGNGMASFIIEEVGCITNVPTEKELLERCEKHKK